MSACFTETMVYTFPSVGAAPCVDRIHNCWEQCVTNKRYFIGLIGVLALAVSSPAPVFQRWGQAGKQTATSPDSWKRAYHATIVLNGGEGNLALFSAPDSCAVSLKMLADKLRTQGAHGFQYCGYYMGWGIFIRDGHVIRLLAISLNDASTLIFRFEQSLSAFRRGFNPERQAMPAGIPMFPGSVSTSHIADRDAGVRLSVVMSGATPARVRAFYMDRLEGDGWGQLAPGGDHPVSSGLDIYARGNNELCLVSVKSAGYSGGSVITLLYKRLKH